MPADSAPFFVKLVYDFNPLVYYISDYIQPIWDLADLEYLNNMHYNIVFVAFSLQVAEEAFNYKQYASIKLLLKSQSINCAFIDRYSNLLNDALFYNPVITADARQHCNLDDVNYTYSSNELFGLIAALLHKKIDYDIIFSRF